jgi:hypothetical protein
MISLLRDTTVKTALSAWLLLVTAGLSGFEVDLGWGARTDVPEAWTSAGEDFDAPTWYSPDREAVFEVRIWQPGTFGSVEELADIGAPEGAQGDVARFDCWNGEAILADYQFSAAGGVFRGWFLYVVGDGPDIRLAAFSPAASFERQWYFLLSCLDAYVPRPTAALEPGAVSVFYRGDGPSESAIAAFRFGDHQITWDRDLPGEEAAQALIEREALVLRAYARVPELFYPAWKRYYRLIYRDNYTRLEPLARALSSGPLPPGEPPESTAAKLLSWLQGFAYGSSDSFSDLLAPPTACATGVGDCDALGLSYLSLLDRYGISGRLLLTQKGSHAVAAVDVEGEGLRYTEGDATWLVAELTTRLPLGELPDRLQGIDDWFAVDLPDNSEL